MSIRFPFATLRLAHVLNLLACAVSLLMLLAFPLRSAHQYTNHYRAPEIRRAIERNTPIAHPEAETAECIAHQAVLPRLLAPTHTGEVAEPVSNIEFFSQVPLSRLLLRLKLGSSRSGGQDHFFRPR